jgi:hypothetical protein
MSRALASFEISGITTKELARYLWQNHRIYVQDMSACCPRAPELAGIRVRASIYMIHNSKVGGSIPPPATNFALILYDLPRLDALSLNARVANLCPEQTAWNI